eukprot:CAMPEP_0205809656 /NCGR_PEP_ID=MMETSP0205-20121125/13908_1 /ASSEMBLY_ACC=CAM_ASM_000278 /TAXON_ID=36767 /ORGANISM="Euplotes focardii, Strain TN1" /LENGTH=42 /DNA_ID= /DNA_START= /DNA_END= /DNA_ORIENTATION=
MAMEESLKSVQGDEESAPEEAKDDEKNEDDYLAEAFSLNHPK